MSQQKLKTALVLGATGLVGQQVLKLLQRDPRYGQITCLLRKPLPHAIAHSDPARLQPVVIDFDKLHDYQGYFSVDHVYVCLGTTIQSAGSRAAFRKVDFEYVHAAAQLASVSQAGSFVWISSVGANANSASFYLRVKGELEEAIFALSGLPHSATVRPSLLLGQRAAPRLAESLGICIGNLVSPLLLGPLKKYRPVPADTVAQQMINLQHWSP